MKDYRAWQFYLLNFRLQPWKSILKELADYTIIKADFTARWSLGADLHLL